MSRSFGGILAALAVAACAAGAPVRAPVRADGGILVDDEGRTVYTFDRDRRGASACTGDCAARWPPIPAPADARAYGRFSVIVRDDGSRQWAYDGKPLYRRAADAGPGDRGGDGADNLWRVARP
jgi:predicted lipoprotein with Yx(FWY)xxD motif